MESDDSKTTGILKKDERPSNKSDDSFFAKKKVPLKTRLRGLKPKQAKYAIETRPMQEEAYFDLFKLVNFICGQFHEVRRIEYILYKRMKWKKAQPHLRVSPASKMKDDHILIKEK